MNRVNKIIENCKIIEITESTDEETEKTLLLTNAEYFIREKENALIYKSFVFRNGNIYKKNTGEKVGAYNKLFKICNCISNNRGGKDFIIKVFRRMLNKELTELEIQDLFYYCIEGYPPLELIEYNYNYLVKEIEKTIECNIKKKIDFIQLQGKVFLENEFYSSKELKNTRYNNINIPLTNFILSFVDFTEKIEDTSNLFIYPLTQVFFVEIKIISKKNVDEELHNFFVGEQYNIFYDEIYYNNLVLFAINNTSNQKDNFVIPSNFYVENDNVNPLQLKIVNALKYINNHFSSIEQNEIDMYIPSFTMSKHTGKKVLERKPCAVKGHLRHYKSGKVTLVRPFLRNGIGLNYGVCIKI